MHATNVVSFTCVAVVAFVAACSSTSSPPQVVDSDVDATDVGGTSDGAADAANDAADTLSDTSPGCGDATADSGTVDASKTCSDIVLSGSFVDWTADPNPAPKLAGGTIVPGDYVLSKCVLYNSSDASKQLVLKWTERFTCFGFESVIQPKGYSGDQRTSGPFVTSGSSITFKATCPKSATSPGTYEATPTTFTRAFPATASGAVPVYYYTKS